MWPLVFELILESLVAPFLIAGFILFGARHLGEARLLALAPALAIVLALGITTIIAFGWPPTLVLNARTKILFSAFIGLALGLAAERHAKSRAAATAVAALGIPIWVGIPALQEAGLESALLLLIPVTLGLLLLIPSSDGPDGSGQRSKALTMLILAAGFAAIAAFARTLSFTALGLALASALLLVVTIGSTSFSTAAAITAAAPLIALVAALLLYTDASLVSVLILSTVIGARWMACFFGRLQEEPSIGRIFLVSLLPLALAILAARIDAGAISIY